MTILKLVVVAWHGHRHPASFLPSDVSPSVKLVSPWSISTGCGYGRDAARWPGSPETSGIAQLFGQERQYKVEIIQTWNIRTSWKPMYWIHPKDRRSWEGQYRCFCTWDILLCVKSYQFILSPTFSLSNSNFYKQFFIWLRFVVSDFLHLAPTWQGLAGWAIERTVRGGWSIVWKWMQDDLLVKTLSPHQEGVRPFFFSLLHWLLRECWLPFTNVRSMEEDGIY